MVSNSPTYPLTPPTFLPLPMGDDKASPLVVSGPLASASLPWVHWQRFSHLIQDVFIVPLPLAASQCVARCAVPSDNQGRPYL